MRRNKTKIVFYIFGILTVISFVVIYCVMPSKFRNFMDYDYQMHYTDHVILTMEELGYEKHFVLSAEYRDQTEFGSWYEIEIANEEGDPIHDGYMRFQVSICDVDHDHDIDAVLREYMTKKKDDSAPTYGEGHINLTGHAWNEENIFEYYVDMSDTFSNVEKAYALYDMKHIPKNPYYLNNIFLVKDQRIVCFAYLVNSDFTLNDERIAVIESLFEREIK